MDKPNKLIVFDCDGTLVDSQHNIITAMQRAYQQVGLPEEDDTRIRSIVGLSVLEAVEALRPEDDAGVHQKIAGHFKNEFLRLRTQQSVGPDPLYPHTKEVIDHLNGAGFLLGVATGNSDRGLARVIAEHDLDGLFVTLQTADGHPSKPHPSMIVQAMADAGAAPETTLMVGDTSYDMMMARSANCAAVGVNWGYHSDQDLLAGGAQHILTKFLDLIPIAETLDKE